LSVSIPSKKSKSHVGSSHNSFAWEHMSIEIDAVDLIDSISDSIQNQEPLKAVSF